MASHLFKLVDVEDGNKVFVPLYRVTHFVIREQRSGGHAWIEIDLAGSKAPLFVTVSQATLLEFRDALAGYCTARLQSKA